MLVIGVKSAYLETPEVVPGLALNLQVGRRAHSSFCPCFPIARGREEKSACKNYLYRLSRSCSWHRLAKRPSTAGITTNRMRPRPG